MHICAGRFNFYLAAALVFLLCGCQTGKTNKPVSTLRVHIELTGMATSNLNVARTVSVLRADPVLVTVADAPVLTEANVLAARVMSAPGGFAIEIQFDQTGELLLEQYTAANSGRHLIIFSQWGDKPGQARWLAAPLITHRIADGLLSFTADASREEADRIVLGLNNAAKKLQAAQK